VTQIRWWAVTGRASGAAAGRRRKAGAHGLDAVARRQLIVDVDRLKTFLLTDRTPPFNFQSANAVLHFTFNSPRIKLILGDKDPASNKHYDDVFSVIGVKKSTHFSLKRVFNVRFIFFDFFYL